MTLMTVDYWRLWDSYCYIPYAYLNCVDSLACCSLSILPIRLDVSFILTKRNVSTLFSHVDAEVNRFLSHD